MVADMFLGKPKQKKIVKDSNLKKDLVSFVSKQFSELLKKICEYQSNFINFNLLDKKRASLPLV